MQNKNLEEFLMMKTHDEVVDKVYSAIGNNEFLIHEDKKHTIIVPSDLLYGDKKDLMPCIVAHTDTVSTKKPTTLVEAGGIVSNPNGVLGADDRAGCYAIWRMLKANVRAIYILTDEEECGGLGAYECGASTLFDTIIPNISALIELDREGSKDIALYGYDNTQLVRLFEDRGYAPAMGSYTDVVDLAAVSNIACINLSVGYYNQHSKKEYLVLSELYKTIDMVVMALPKELYEEVYMDELEPLNGIPPEDAILCDCCNQHEPLYSTAGGDMCIACVDYGDSWRSYTEYSEAKGVKLEYKMA